MNLYTTLSTRAGTHEAAELGARLAAWHDAMVAHERRIRAGSSSATCDEECPHAEARVLWREAVATFGDRAHELVFLRSRAQGSGSAALSQPRAHGLHATEGRRSTSVAPRAASAADS